MMKRLILLTTISLILFGAVFGCEIKDEAVDEPIRILYGEWPPDMLVYLAQEKGFFEKNGVDVELVWAPGFQEAQEIRANGGTDIWNYTLLDFVTEFAEEKEREGQIFLIEDFSNGADALITLEGNGIEFITDLRGMTVGVEGGTVGEFFLDIILSKHDMTLEDLNTVNLAADEVPDALKAGDIIAGVSYEPHISEFVSDGGVVIVDSSSEPGLIVDVFVAKKAHIRAHFIEYAAISKSILEAGVFFKNNPDESANIIAPVLDLTPEEVMLSFEGLYIPTLSENKIRFNKNSGPDSIHNLARLAQQYLEDRAVLNKTFNLDPLINSNIIQSI